MDEVLGDVQRASDRVDAHSDVFYVELVRSLDAHFKIFDAVE